MPEQAADRGHTEALDEMSKVIARHRALEMAKDGIAREVYSLVDTAINGNVRLPDAAQLQNLRSLANQTQSLQELVIFIRYQTARHGAPIGDQFGGDLLQSIESVRLGAVNQAGAGQDGGTEAMERVRLFLGYLYRYVRAARPQLGGRQR